MVNSHCNRTTASFHKDFMRRSIVEAFARAMIQFFLRLLQVLFLLQSQSLFLSGSPVGCADRKEAHQSCKANNQKAYAKQMKWGKCPFIAPYHAMHNVILPAFTPLPP